MAYTTSHRSNMAANIALLFTYSFAGAGFGRNKVQNKLSKQVRDFVAKSGMTRELQGEAVVFFTVDAQQYIRVKGVFGTNGMLIRHIEDALRGKQVPIKGLEAGEEFQTKLKFNDLI